jgi:hypothetical protein
MKILALLLPVSLGVAALACGEPEPRQGLQIDPIGSQAPDPAKDKDTAKDDTDKGAHEAADKVPAPAADAHDAGSDRVNDCASAVDLGQMSGEPKNIGEAAETLGTQGHCSKWIKLRVNEKSSAREPLAINATLNSPSSTKFDLHAYVNKEKDESACGMEPTLSSATTLSNVDEINLTWGDDGWWWSSADDSRTVIFEVRSANGACDATSSWSLVVHTTTATN